MGMLDHRVPLYSVTAGLPGCTASRTSMPVKGGRPLLVKGTPYPEPWPSGTSAIAIPSRSMKPSISNFEPSTVLCHILHMSRLHIMHRLTGPYGAEQYTPSLSPSFESRPPAYRRADRRLAAPGNRVKRGRRRRTRYERRLPSRLAGLLFLHLRGPARQ